MTEVNIEDMKCCGNCVYRECMWMDDYSSEMCTKNKYTVSWEYCPKWEYDGHLRRDRMTD